MAANYHLSVPSVDKLVDTISNLPEPWVDSWTFHSMRIAPAVGPLTVKSISEIWMIPESPGAPTHTITFRLSSSLKYEPVPMI
jgi:hypothetical protein